MHRAFVVRVVALCLAFGVLASSPRPAAAQSVAVGASKGITRTVGFRDRVQRRYWVSKADCEHDDVISFPVTITGYAGYLFQVWAGATDCSDPTQRASATAAQCWKVYQNSYSVTGPGGSITVPISARVIVAQVPPSDVKGTDPVPAADGSVCEKGGQQAIALYFMLVDTTGTVIGKAPAWQASTNEQGMGFDISGPAPPTGLELGVGENRLHATWTASTESDIVGYNLYCDPPPGGLGGADASTLGFDPSYRTLALDAGSLGAGGAAALGSGGATGSASDAGAIGTGGAAGATGAGGNGVVTDGGFVFTDDGGVASRALNCAPTSLTAGTIPDGKYLCGYTPNVAAKTGTAEHLLNDVNYVVGVSAIDTVGNVGPLSENKCGIPVQITDYFELYRQLGGKGGGLCSFSHRRSPPGGALAAAGLVAALVLARKVRRRS